jgi:DNA-binding CsgD family transcriptional regulator
MLHQSVSIATLDARRNDTAGPLGAAPAPAPAAVGTWMRSVLDHLDYGIVLIDGQARALHANVAATRLLQQGDLLRLSDGLLEVAVRRDDDAWRKALQDARRGLRSLVRVGGSTCGVGVAVVPLTDPGSGAHVVTFVVLGRPSICESLSTQWYARRHALTQAESKVLALLCGGLRPSEIAHRLAVQISTVRTHICSIRSKTGVASVGALLHEIATLPPMAQALQGVGPLGAWLQ